MIPETSPVTVESTVRGDAIAMAIDAADMPHIMGVLTNMYADPELACIREYAGNALDSHIAAGQTRPIEIGLPTDLRPMLTIRDWGVGLSADDIRSIFSQYGRSTKRGTNDAVGMLGIGCKSALSYTDQFTVEARKDGQRIVVSIARDERGVGTMTVLELGATDEPAGVAVLIPTKPGNSFEDKADELFPYWEPGTVLVNGAAPEPVDGYAIGDTYLVREHQGRYAYNATPGAQANRLTIVQGNIPYDATGLLDASDAALSLPTERALTARVPIGSFMFAPSRESLLDSPANRKALEKLLADFTAAVNDHANHAINAAATAPDAVRALVANRDMLGQTVTGAEWRGKPVPTRIGFDPEMAKLPSYEQKPTMWHVPAARSGSYGNERMDANGVELAQAAAAVWVTDFDNTTWTAQMRSKLSAYCDAHGVKSRTRAGRAGHHGSGTTPTDGRSSEFVLIAASEVPDADWIGESARTISWQDVRAWKVPRAAAPAGVPSATMAAGTYKAFKRIKPEAAKPEGRRYVPPPQCWEEIEAVPAATLAAHAAKGGVVALSENGKYGRPEYGGHGDQHKTLPIGTYFVSLPANRIKKFKRLVPGCVRMSDAIATATKSKRDELSPAETLALSSSSIRATDAARNLAKLGDNLPDPRLRRLAAALAAPLPEGVGSVEGAPHWRKLINRYPLLNACRLQGNLDTDAMMFYITAAYAADRK